MASKRKAGAMSPTVEEPVDPNDELMFLCLGGGNEVGRSCHIIQYKGKTVMVSAPIEAVDKDDNLLTSTSARRWNAPCLRRSFGPTILR